MTPQDIITSARYILQDTDSAAYRQSNAELLGYVNDGFREAVILRPEFFTSVSTLACAVGQVEQTATFANAVNLVEVLAINNSTALTRFDVSTMTAFNPDWRTDTAAAATQWAPVAGDPLNFYVYPKPSGAQTLSIRYVRNPTTYTLSDAITDLPLTYQPVLVDYVVYRSESKDAEHVLSQRAQQTYMAFVTKMKG